MWVACLLKEKDKVQRTDSTHITFAGLVGGFVDLASNDVDVEFLADAVGPWREAVGSSREIWFSMAVMIRQNNLMKPRDNTAIHVNVLVGTIVFVRGDPLQSTARFKC